VLREAEGRMVEGLRKLPGLAVGGSNRAQTGRGLVESVFVSERKE